VEEERLERGEVEELLVMVELEPDTELTVELIRIVVKNMIKYNDGYANMDVPT
jgi:hypothetical protein